MIALDELAGGTAADYSNHVFMTIDYLSTLYSKMYDMNAVEVLQNIITYDIDQCHLYKH